MKNVDRNYYPGWVRKAITFTIDDGNIPLDTKFISIVRPAGIKGTFNIGSPKLDQYTAEEYRTLYRGFGISNHCKLHPFALTPEKEAIPLGDGLFDPAVADKEKRYATALEGVYKYFHNGRYWANLATPEAYCRLVDAGKADIEAVFGKGTVNTYVWPYSEQKNEQIVNYIRECGDYIAMRATGELRDSTGFSLPADRMRWRYNAQYNTVCDVAALFEAYEDDGELKFFSFGVHSHDFENNNRWDELERFAELYGNRPEDFWYASVEEIFAYEDAVRGLIVTDTAVENPSDITVYIKVDGKRVTLDAHCTYSLA